MIETVELNFIELKEHIIKDFKGVIKDIKKDYKDTIDLLPICYGWVEDDVLLGYMCMIYFDTLTYSSYTKMKDRRIYKKMYEMIHNVYHHSNNKGLPLLIDNTNLKAYGNHVVPYKDTELYEWKL